MSPSVKFSHERGGAARCAAGAGGAAPPHHERRAQRVGRRLPVRRGRGARRQAVPLRGARRSAQRHRRRRPAGQRAVRAGAVAPADALLHQLPAGGAGGVRHRAHPHVGAAVRAHGRVPVHGPPALLLLPRVPAPHALRVPNRQRRADHVGVPHADRDRGTLGGGVPPLPRQGAVHVVPRALVRAGHGRLRLRLQRAQVLRGGGDRALRGRRARVLRHGRPAVPHRVLHRGVHPLHVHDRHVHRAVLGAGGAQRVHRAAGAARAGRARAAVARAAARAGPGHHAAGRRARVLPVQPAAARHQLVRGVPRRRVRQTRPARQDEQPASDNQQQRQFCDICDIWREVQASISKDVLRGRRAAARRHPRLSGAHAR